MSTRTISGSFASRPHNKSSCKTEQTRGCRSIAPASVWSWRRGAAMFSNRVDLMETLMSLVVFRTLFLLLPYSVVGTTIKLWNCLGYSGSRLLCVRLAVHVRSLLLFRRGAPACSRATLKSGIWNRKETENQNQESTYQRKQVLQIRKKIILLSFCL